MRAKSSWGGGGLGGFRRIGRFSPTDLQMIDTSFTKAIQNLKSERFIPVRIYIHTEDSEAGDQMSEALKQLAEAYDISIHKTYPPEWGSWLQNFLGRAKEHLTEPEVVDIFQKAKQAAELQVLDKPQAGITKEKAEAIQCVMQSLGNVQNASIQFGTLVIEKRTKSDGVGNIVVRDLTIEQMKEIARNPSLLNHPEGVLVALSKAIRLRDVLGDVGSEDIGDGVPVSHDDFIIEETRHDNE